MSQTYLNGEPWPTPDPEPTPLEFCGNEFCGRIVVRERDTGVWTHWGDAIRECKDGNIAQPGGVRRTRRPLRRPIAWR